MPQNATLTLTAQVVPLLRADQIPRVRRDADSPQEAQAKVQAMIERCELQISLRQTNLATCRQTAEDLLLSARACEALSACAAEGADALDAYLIEVSRAGLMMSDGEDPAMASHHGQMASLDAKTTSDSEIQAEKIADLKQLLLQIDALGLNEAEAAEQQAFAARSVGQFLEVSQFQADDYASQAMAYRMSAAPYLARVEAMESELRMYQDMLRDDLLVLRDKLNAMNAAQGVEEPANLPVAGSDDLLVDATITTTTTTTVPKDDDQDFDRSSEPATIGMVVVENTPWFMPQHPIAAGWQDYVNPPALKAAAGMAIAAHLLFPDMAEVLVGLLGDT